MSALVVLLGGRVPMWVEGGRGWLLDTQSREWRALDTFSAFGGRVLLEVGRAEEAKADFRRFLADPTVPSNSDKAAFALKAIER